MESPPARHLHRQRELAGVPARIPFLHPLLVAQRQKILGFAVEEQPLHPPQDLPEDPIRLRRIENHDAGIRHLLESLCDDLLHPRVPLKERRVVLEDHHRMVVLLQDRLELERGERPPDLEPRHGPVNVRQHPREVPADKERHVPLEVLALVKERDEPVCRCDHDVEPALLEGDAGGDFELHRDQEMLCAGVLREGKGRVKVK